jgi:predicted Rdx family selenoprotein
MRVPEEEAVVELAKRLYDIDVDDEQLWWRRRKISLNGADMFKQRISADTRRAFISTGRPSSTRLHR